MIRLVSSETFLTWSKPLIIFKLSSMFLADNFDNGISAWYFASMSLHWIPRGPDARGASTVLVKRAPDLVTMVTVPP